MKITSQYVPPIEPRREYILKLSREELSMLRGLHFRLHNNPQRSVRDALGLYKGHSDTDGPAGYELYDSFLGLLWAESNQFNGEQ